MRILISLSLSLAFLRIDSILVAGCFRCQAGRSRNLVQEEKKIESAMDLIYATPSVPGILSHSALEIIHGSFYLK